MELQITNQSGIYQLQGSLTSNNFKKAKDFFKEIIGKTNIVIVSLNSLVEIDHKGARTLIKLYRKAMRNDTVFYMVGKDNGVVCEQFRQEKIERVLHKTLLFKCAS